MEKLISNLDAINEKFGKLFSWSTTILVWVMFIDVIFRYLFDFTFIWITELETYFFAFIFLIGAGYAFKHDKHVRVDVFYARMTARKKAWVNLIGGTLFLLPWAVVSFIVCYKYAMYSFKIGESSPQPGGLPALYALKFIMVIGFLLLIIQAITSILRSIHIIKTEKPVLP